MARFMKKYVIGGCFLLYASGASAWNLSDIWLRPDQIAAHYLKIGQAEQAATTFEDPAWRAIAQYRAKQYGMAEKTFSLLSIPDASYNRANALAQLGQYQAAIDVYEAVLKKDPKNADARFNRDLLKQILAVKHQTPPVPKVSRPQAGQSDNQRPQDPTLPQSSTRSTKAQEHKKTQPQPTQNLPEANAQWLRQVPDDPGGLLREKFLRDHIEFIEKVRKVVLP